MTVLLWNVLSRPAKEVMALMRIYGAVMDSDWNRVGIMELQELGLCRVRETIFYKWGNAVFYCLTADGIRVMNGEVVVHNDQESENGSE